MKTLCHEHVVIDLSGVKNDPGARMEDKEAIVEDLCRLAAAGIERIIDLTGIGMGRDVAAARALCEKAHIAVLFSTGFYKEPFLPQIVFEKSESELAELMIKEITTGIQDTGEKARVIGEIGTGDEISAAETRVFRAAARAQRETGVPIYTHTTLGRLGLEQVEILTRAGADTEKVVIGHVDLNPDLDYYLRLLERGVYLGFDTIGKQTYQPDTVRASLIVELSNMGYAGRLVLSTDVTRLSHLRRYGGYGRAYLTDSFIPMLRNLGLSERDLELMLSETPDRLFGPA